MAFGLMMRGATTRINAGARRSPNVLGHRQAASDPLPERNRVGFRHGATYGAQDVRCPRYGNAGMGHARAFTFILSCRRNGSSYATNIAYETAIILIVDATMNAYNAVPVIARVQT